MWGIICKWETFKVNDRVDLINAAIESTFCDHLWSNLLRLNKAITATLINTTLCTAPCPNAYAILCNLHSIYSTFIESTAMYSGELGLTGYLPPPFIFFTIFPDVCTVFLEQTTRIPAKARFGRPYGKNGRLGGHIGETGSRKMVATQKINSLTLVSYSLPQTVFR